MKRFVSIFFIALSLSLTAKEKNANKKELRKLWDKYEESKMQDLPETSVRILEKIKEKAVKEQLSADFYEALNNIYSIKISGNWKLRESLQQEQRREVEKFDEPIVSFLFAQNDYSKTIGEIRSSLQKIIKENAERLKNKKNTYFYSSVGALDGVISETISNDYEYCLWEINDYNALAEYIGERYPASAYLEFEKAGDLRPESECLEAMRVLAKKYEGTAMALYPEGELLSSEFYSIKRTKANEPKFRAFYEKLKEFEKGRKKFNRGIDGKIASDYTLISDIREDLERKSGEVAVEEGEVKVILTNLSSTSLKCLARVENRGKPLWIKDISCEVGSFYVPDTLSFKLPELDDGEYSIVSKAPGLEEQQTYFTKKTISLALRNQSDGYAVYATDYKTGKALGEYTVSLLEKGEILKKTTVVSDGNFTLLPKEFFKGRNYCSIICSLEENGTKRVSNEIFFTHGGFGRENESNRIYGNIYKDRGAYNPGDMVKFKAVLYEKDPSKGISVLKEAVECEARLNDSEDNTLKTIKLITNGFGSVAGEFELPKDKRNGIFGIEISIGGKAIAAESFTVDEFVLPTFDISIDEDSTLHFEKDSLKIKGKVSSYSGHTLSNADVSISFNGRYDKKVTLRSGGFFESVLTKEEREEYGLDNGLNIELKVVDATGETRSAHTTRFITETLYPVIRILNKADTEFAQIDRKARGTDIVCGKTLQVKLSIPGSEKASIPFEYELLDEKGIPVTKGLIQSEKEFEISLPASGCYSMKASAVKSEKYESRRAYVRIISVSESDKVLDAPVDYIIYRKNGERDIKLRIGSAKGAIYAVATLFGTKGRVLGTQVVELKGIRGEEGSLKDISFSYMDSYPDAVRAQVFFFKNGNAATYSTVFHREKKDFEFPLAFSRFKDKTAPGEECRIIMKSSPDVEAVASVFDKSVETIAPNIWSSLPQYRPEPEYVIVMSSPGDFGSEKDIPIMIRGLSKNAAANAYEEAVAFSLFGDSALKVRESFGNTLAFLPFLNSGKDGTINFGFKTSEKLSTYIVKVLAHDRQMRSKCAEKQFVVSVPVKISIAEPRYLYENDSYILQAAVESEQSVPISGNLQLSLFNTRDYKNAEAFSEQASSLNIPAGGGGKAEFAIALPKGIKNLGVKLVFVSSDKKYSDGIFVNIPVKKSEQSLTEAHSAVLKRGADRDKIIEELSGRFVNADRNKAVFKEISLLDMIKETIAEKENPEAGDVLSLSEAYYIRAIASSLVPSAAAPDAAFLKKILDCRNADGGFAWFEGMESSSIISAVVLERFAKLREHGFAVPELASTVRFLDDSQLSGHDSRRWYSSISLAQYLHLRSMYPEVAFEPKVVGDAKIFKKNLSAFKVGVRKYLTPGKKRGRNGRIFEKARRVLTLERLCASEDGLNLAKALGVSAYLTSARLNNSIKADVRSLEEYAQEHRDGGKYYPNAVMPWRGLLESEAYAHSVLCDLMSRHNAEIADGIRLWLMLQKESQNWEVSAEYIDVVNSVLAGSREILDTKVLAMSACYTKAFSQIKSAGNEMSVERKFFREKNGSREEIAAGTVLDAGEKIIAEYILWSKENRSHVRLRSSREASLMPVDQKSGYRYWNYYCNVKSDCTEYYFEAFPEEKTIVTETFYVTQKGTFTAPVLELESLYTPHYRANSQFWGALKSE